MQATKATIASTFWPASVLRYTVPRLIAPHATMAVDPYTICPCGSGKKLKFCCSDLYSEIDKVHRMLEGDQPRAALAHLEQTLAKSPGRASLLDLKATIELSLNDRDSARQTVDQYLEVDPQNPSAHAQAAILAAGEASGSREEPQLGPDSPSRRAVNHLQDAMQLIAEEMPSRVLQAIGAIGQALLASGDLIAARAHLWLYQGVAGEDDTRAMELLMRLNQVADLPLILRDNLFLRELPVGHAAEAQHDHAQLLASRGQWRRSAEALEKLCSDHPQLAVLQYNRAVVSGWLGDQEQFIEGLQKFASMLPADASGTPTDDAIEAEAIAQLLDLKSREPAIEVVQVRYSIAEEESLVDRLTRDKRVTPHKLSESELQGMEGPPPRSTHLLLDRDLPASGADLADEAVPRIVGILSFFGRQTDREERLELVVDRDEHFGTTLELVDQIAGDSLSGKIDEQVVGTAAGGGSALRSRWRFPDDTPIADRRRIVSTEQRRVLLEDWPEKPLAKLGGQSPQTAAGDPSQKLAVLAAVLVLEQSAASAVDPQVFTTLREKLGLAAVGAIDPRTADLEILPLARVPRVDLSQASDEDLVALYRRTELAGATEAIRLIAREAVNRPSLGEELPLEELYARLAGLEPDLEEALGWVERGRTAADDKGISNAQWDLAELELRVMEGQFEEANNVVQHLRSEHLAEPGIPERLYQLLYSLGAVPAPGQQPMAEAPPAEAAISTAANEPASGSKLWTPGADEPSGSGQKIWTPS